MTAVSRGYSGGYPTGVKIGVSLSEEQVAAARKAVAEGRAASVSAYIADAITRAERTHALSELLDDLDRELGEPGSAAVAWADAELIRTGLIDP
jgi:Arc/MetJ-type ribon-helix-helix transcriptional regulator